MASFVGWLDYSDAERRQVQDLLQFFSEGSTVDDLGIGTLRDAISNRLFPGTSVTQSRARYYLFIPWIWQRAETKHRANLIDKAEGMERWLIQALLTSDDQQGLIGRQAGKDVKTLPSAIYWTGLAAYGIFQRPPLTRAQYSRAAQSARSRPEHEDELADRSDSFWRPGIPDPPEDFWKFGSADFSLTRDEAEWLSERVLSTRDRNGSNLLSDFVMQLRRQADLPDGAFWEGPLPATCTEETLALVHHAERFSSAVEGASLLYNLLLADCRNDVERGDADYADQLRVDLKEWAVRAQATGTDRWAVEGDAFLNLVSSYARIPLLTRRFVSDWCQILASDSLSSLDTNKAATALIRTRERQHKRGQARFDNPSRLRAWEGESGVRPLDFRWTQVRRFLRDVGSGLHQSRAADTNGAAHAAD